MKVSVVGGRKTGYIYKYCDRCRNLFRKEHGTKAAIKQYGGIMDSAHITKGELIVKYGKSEAPRSYITRQARAVYFSSDKPKHCACCVYSKHIDVCHIKSISSLPDSATVQEMNALSNLVGLCKTHHWEFDRGIMDDDLLLKIKI